MRWIADRPSTTHGVGKALCALLMASLIACADKPPAPIEDHSRPGTPRSDQRYTVLRGDTLFAIAFRYGLDYRRLAAANGIAPPYTIYPGQRLRLAEGDLPVVAAAPASGTTPGSDAARDIGSPATATATVKTAPANAVKAASQGGSATSAKTAPPLASRPAVSGSSPRSAAQLTTRSGWRWPATGSVTRRFESNLHKGIDIAGARGDAVSAAAPGQVVYAGSGIPGYGLLLIVRHSDEYLSAYGHSDALLVEEGDEVDAGQTIAQIGSSGTNGVKLYFEIRRRGRPVDPLRLLPTR